MLPEEKIFERVGVDGFTRLCQAFYRRVPSDDILGPMYPAQDMDGAEERLTSFLIYRFGGPQTYIEQRGHPRLRMRHAPFEIDQAARDRWMELMDGAFKEAALDQEAEATLRAFFEHMSTFMINRAS